ncbi:Alpha N-terminal protein methyltransferase 1 [Madurella mycetomatis]|uniref:Alpha N-terminal protein methyltransferase 1 n=1 Tax=Madurella mycetomatis TaxID=100816 RepID=A0A175VX43_9PEZI|nr:Alpha N-terminal protein methyltransferase 1 [Madurella mycetomatis]
MSAETATNPTSVPKPKQPKGILKKTTPTPWNQGCICHLSDAQVVQYLEKCKSALWSKDGLVIVKENLSIRGADVFDSRDSTVLREDRKFLSLFQQAGLRLVKAEFQRGLPATFLPVKMYALAQREED